MESSIAVIQVQRQKIINNICPFLTLFRVRAHGRGHVHACGPGAGGLACEGGARECEAGREDDEWRDRPSIDLFSRTTSC
jgi:hypothetical protein